MSIFNSLLCFFAQNLKHLSKISSWFIDFCDCIHKASNHRHFSLTNYAHCEVNLSWIHIFKNVFAIRFIIIELAKKYCKIFGDFSSILQSLMELLLTFQASNLIPHKFFIKPLKFHKKNSSKIFHKKIISNLYQKQSSSQWQNFLQFFTKFSNLSLSS